MRLTNQSISSVGFSIGICATGSAEGLPSLVETLLSEHPPKGLQLRRLIVVASACPKSIVSKLLRLQEVDSRVRLLSESLRHGKANAVNQVIALTEGELLVMVNSDAVPERGAVTSLLSVMASNPSVGVVSASPVPAAGKGLASTLAHLMWTAHNDCSLVLNHLNLSNHASEELVVFRMKAIEGLPEGLVNDGAFLAGTARNRGYSVRFCPPARVHIETPNKISDLISQRRRILFGHAQVWQRIGRPPKTIESLLLFSPVLGLRILADTIARHPKYLLVLPAAAVSELTSVLLAAWDGIRSTRRHAVWRRIN